MRHSHLFLLAAGVLLLSGCNNATPPDTTTSSSSESSATSSAPQTVSDGTISFSVPADFALAVQGEAIQKSSYIPPCDQGFTYCVYDTGNQYQGTNFESAGLSIVKRTDLTSKQTCLTTQPDGYTGITPVTHEDASYATSVFAPLGDAAMGHYAQDQLYRLSVGNSCYEFRTRIGSSQYANYPAGSIQEFTKADEAAVQSSLDSILHGITLKDGTSLTFPTAPSSAGTR